YFISFAIPEHNPKMHIGHQSDKKLQSIKNFSVLDAQLNKVWAKEINTGKDKFYYDYWSSDQSVFLLNRRHYKKYIADIIEIYDFKNGLITEFSIKDPTYNILMDEVEFSNTEVILYTMIYEAKDKDMTHEKMLGYTRIILDKKTGQEKKRDYLLWDDFKPHIVTKNKYGGIP